MAQKTDAQLQTQNDTIQTETTANANTAARIGQMYEDIIDSKINNDKIVDEDDMVSNSATLVPSQQSVKAYVDAIGDPLWGEITGTLGDQTDLQTALGLKANLASPALTGTPTAPTASPGTDTTQIATTAFVQAEMAGVKDLWIDAGAMQPRVTNGCDILRPYEMTTSLFNLTALAFDQTTQEFADFKFVLPRSYNNGTITFIPHWTAQTGSGTVQWGVSFVSFRNDDAFTTGPGTPQTSDDTLISVNDEHIGPESAAITPAGTLAGGNLMMGRISRNPASDTLSGDALLIGIVLRITVTSQIDS